ncbi:MAG TPA: GNAT family N-acetyltransferase [Gemmatimonadaceae bacterium]
MTTERTAPAAPATPASLEPLRRETAARELPALAAADADTIGEPWTAAHWLLDLPEKWTLSRLARAADGGVAGFLVASVRDGRVHIHRVAVAPTHRGRGLGTRLVTDAARSALALGASELSLKVHRSNAPALALYRRLGFHERAAPGETITMIARAELVPGAR